MSNQYVVNRKALKAMQEIAGNFVIKANGVLVKVNAALPKDGDKRVNRKDNLGDKIATKKSGNMALVDLPHDSLLEFAITLISPIHYTDFKHELLAKQNEAIQEFTDSFSVFANVGTIELSATHSGEFLGQAIDLDSLHKFIGIFVKQATQDKKVSQQWRKAKGSYQVKDNNEFVSYASIYGKKAPKAEIVDNGESAENLAPNAPSMDELQIESAMNEGMIQA